MSAEVKKEDLRIIKTRKVLLETMLKLLNLRNFSRLTVNDLCEEAQISRPTFYSHFKDKYDLLEFCLEKVKLENKIQTQKDIYKQIEKTINQYIRNNTKVVTNLLVDANNETLDLLHQFVLSIFNIFLNEDWKNTSEYIILSSFCIGGIFNLLYWQIENKFPLDLEMINPYFYSILKSLLTDHTNKEYKDM